MDPHCVPAGSEPLTGRVLWPDLHLQPIFIIRAVTDFFLNLKSAGNGKSMGKIPDK